LKIAKIIVGPLFEQISRREAGWWSEV